MWGEKKTPHQYWPLQKKPFQPFSLFSFQITKSREAHISRARSKGCTSWRVGLNSSVMINLNNNRWRVYEVTFKFTEFISMCYMTLLLIPKEHFLPLRHQSINTCESFLPFSSFFFWFKHSYLFNCIKISTTKTFLGSENKHDQVII